MLSISLSSTPPQNKKTFNSLFLSKTTHAPRSPMKSQDSSNDDIDFVLNCSKRVLSIFQNFKFHNDLCEKCVKFVEKAIKILDEIKNLSSNKKVKIIESNEYSNFNNLIFDIEFYLRKYDQRTAIQSEVKESFQNFVSNLENCINSFQQIYEFEKSKKISGWSKTIGRLIALTKNYEQINHDDDIYDDDDDFVCDVDDPNRLIIQQELIISTGIYHGSNNNIRKGNFISEEIAEKYIGNISKNSYEFSEFQKEIFYIKNLSRDCKNILSINGYFERNGSLWIVEEWAEYNLLDYLRNNLNLDWSIKLTIARGIANALNYIHNLNLLHYNVKIDNVLLNHNLEPKLYKFGKDSDVCIFLKSVQSLKPSNWSAPEMNYTSASEVYNFGIILWEIATQDYQSEDNFFERSYVDDAPANYLTLVEKALDKDPENRPTMQEMFDSLYQLESSYNVRYQKKASVRNIKNTISVVSNSSEDSPTLNDESASCVTSCANSLTSISDDDDIPISANEMIEIEKAIKFHENRQYSKAFKIFNECNKQNPSSIITNYWIGLYYYKGYHKTSKSPKQSIKLSLKHFGEAAKRNHPDAQYYYARILLNNPTTDSEENRFQIALEYLKKASDQNHPPSMRWLGKIMSKGEFGCKKDIETSKILTDRSKRLSKTFAESQNTLFKGNVNQKKSRTLSDTSTTSTTSNVSQKKSRTLSDTSTTSTTLNVNQKKSRTLSSASTTSTTLNVNQKKSRTLSSASTTSTTLNVNQKKSRTLSSASTTSTTLNVNQKKSRTLSNASTTSTTLNVNQKKSRTLSNASTTSTTLNVNQKKIRTLSNTSTTSTTLKKSRTLSLSLNSSTTVDTSNHPSKRNSTVFGSTTIIKVNKTKNRHSTLF
ncbi:hypothetical protein C1645_359358 [Glomus cerebriforme]|uniref:Protein kinase domain-containing protein n=1 Tax=Glomus cerebriforme TaxID=658196 RepID=A0A397SLR8_9GLOM|nr:hypothetical protein C1645_359358 [Glomus cerebriforme]